MTYFAHAAWLRERAEEYGGFAALAMPCVRWRPQASRPPSLSSLERMDRTTAAIYQNARIAAHFGAQALEAERLGALEQEIIEWQTSERTS